MKRTVDKNGIPTVEGLKAMFQAQDEVAEASNSGAVWNTDFDEIKTGRKMFFAPQGQRSIGRMVKVLGLPYTFHGKWFVQVLDETPGLFGPRPRMVRASDLSVD